MSNPAVVTEGPAALSEKAAVIFFVVGPFVALLAGIYFLAAWGWFYPVDLWAMVGMYVLSAVGVTIGFHRMLTHKGFQTYRGIKVLLAVFGSMACEGPVLNWTADHRRHHAHTDVEGDPHSPHLSERRGVWGAFLGGVHAHTGWLFKFERSSKRKYVPDLLDDPDMRRVDALFFLWTALSLAVIPFAVGAAVKGSWLGGLATMLWAGPVRVFFVQHVTWSINSICHMFGQRPFPMDKWTGQSTNNLLIAVPSLGEGFHQNHHSFPRSVVHGILPGQRWLDVSGLIILLMERLRLAWNVQRVSDESIRKRLSEESTFEPTVS